MVLRGLDDYMIFDFTIVYKPSRIHVVVDALSKLLNIVKPISVLDQTTYVDLFYIEPKWLKDVKEFLRTKQIEGMLLV
jgi:hypothetical protein